MEPTATSTNSMEAYRARIDVLAHRFPGDNPLLKGWRRHMAVRDLSPTELPESQDMFQLGEAAWQQKFSYGVPTDAALDAIGPGPVLDMGAGTGYWSFLLRNRGVEVVALDYRPPGDRLDPNGFKYEPNAYCVPIQYTKVEYGMPSAVPEYARTHTLFLVWPPIGNFANECLQHYAMGSRVVHVGEIDLVTGGCTGNLEFCKRLDHEFNKVLEVELPQWPGKHDSLTVWERKRDRSSLDPGLPEPG